MKTENLKLLFKNVFYMRKRPRLIYSVGRGFIRGLIFKKPTLRIIEFQVTFNCDSKCIMCSSSNFTDDKKEQLTLKELENTWRQAQRLGANMAVLTGGEPKMRKDILDIIRMLDPKRTIICLVSNSLNLTREKIRSFKKAGLHSLSISIDGLTPEENDRIRGVPGHFDRAVASIKTGVAEGLNVFLNHTITAKNLHSLSDYDNFARSLGASFNTILLVPTGRAENTDDVLNPELFREFEAFRKSRKLRIDYALNYTLVNSCDAAKEKLCITPSGDVMGCGLVHISFGNVKNEPLEVIWKRMMKHPLYNRVFPGCPGAIDNELMQPHYLAHLKDFDNYPPTIEQLDALRRNSA